MKDARGNTLKLGDRVMIPAIVQAMYEGKLFNLEIKLELPENKIGYRATIGLDAEQVILSRRKKKAKS